MYLSELSLTNFKNHAARSLRLSPQLNAFVGDNGTGKTNLLDAIYYLALSKSAFQRLDQQHIRHGQDFFRLQGLFCDGQDQYRVACQLRAGAKKVLTVNQVPYERISDHIGRFPVVLMAPDDTDLIRGGSEGRRRFFDGVLAQLDNRYLSDLMDYNRLLAQRNSLLKQFADRRYVDRTLLDTYAEPMVALAERLYARRRDFLATFEPRFQHHYQHLTEQREDVSLTYDSTLHADEPFATVFARAARHDLAAQRTTLGIHKDDYTFRLGEHPLRHYGSQGQQKSFVIALRLAQFDSLCRAEGHKPILLLDDIFDKLDEHRIRHLIELVADHHFGQIFLTDARPERTTKIFEQLDAELAIFPTGDLTEGVATPTTSP